MGLARLSHGDTGEHSPSFLPVFNSAWGQTTETGVCTAGALLCLQEMFTSSISHMVTQPRGVMERAAATPGQVRRAAAIWCNRAIAARNLHQVPAVKFHVKSKLVGEREGTNH